MSRYFLSWVVCLWIAVLPGVVAAAQIPTLPGDCDLDWSVDIVDFVWWGNCGSGPEINAATGCECFLIDSDGDVDLHDFAALQTSFTGTQVLRAKIETDADDGTEVNQSIWYEDGPGADDLNRIGAGPGESYEVGLRFHLPEVTQGESFAYVRLVLSATGEGQVDSLATLSISGIDQDSPADFDLFPPSQLPRTNSSIIWEPTSNWPYASMDKLNRDPLHRYSPDISTVINEIVARPGWGSGAEGKTLALAIEDNGTTGTNYLAFRDFPETGGGDCPVKVTSATLELYRTTRSTLIGETLLGHPTDSSVTINAFSLADLEVYFEYGTSPGLYSDQNPNPLVSRRKPHRGLADRTFTRHAILLSTAVSPTRSA